MQALITRKVGMTNIIDDQGTAIAVTLLSARPNVVTQVKSTEIDGYKAIQLGAEELKKANKPQTGHLKGSKMLPRIIREFKASEIPENIKIGERLSADLF